MQKSKKTTKKTQLFWPILAIAAIVLALSLAAIALKTVGNSGIASVGVNQEFSVKVGDAVRFSDIDDTILKLKSIEDGRCESAKNIVCDWQGEIYYRFDYGGSSITISSELNQQQELDDTGYTLNFVSGDETFGLFVLRKEEK